MKNALAARSAAAKSRTSGAPVPAPVECTIPQIWVCNQLLRVCNPLQSFYSPYTYQAGSSMITSASGTSRSIFTASSFLCATWL